MRKLLHERLREIKSLDHIIADNGEFVELFDKEAQAIADEIEKYYIPRPRFENGEPVQFGEKALRWDGKHGNDGENVVSITVEGGDYLSYGFNGDICSSQLFKRPQPKVYDADGVEINVGDTVWSVDDPTESANVSEIRKGIADPSVLFVECVDECENIAFVKIPTNLTHKEPDSLKKLRDDMLNEFATLDRYELKGYANRLSALIERGA